MGKKAVVGWPMFGSTGADMSLSSVTSSNTVLEFKDNVGITLSWTGTSPVGAVKIQHSSDGSTWFDYDFGTSIAISGNTGTHTIVINQTPYDYIQAVYTKTSGTGTLTALLSAKEI